MTLVDGLIYLLIDLIIVLFFGKRIEELENRIEELEGTKNDAE